MLAAIQMNTLGTVAHNLAQIDRLLAQAAAQGATLAVLPEMCLSLNPDDYSALAASAATTEALAELAQKYRLWLLAGAVPQPSPDGDARVRSASLLFNAQGEQVARYDKRHLFDVDVADKQGRYRESERFSPGSELVVVDTPLGRLGLSICFDLRFPEHFLALRSLGAEIISVPAAFTYRTGQAHWHSLLRARAIETQCYLVAANQCGWHDEKRQTWGHSLLLDPWGEVLGELEHQEGVRVAEVKRTLLTQVREAMPLWNRVRG